MNAHTLQHLAPGQRGEVTFTLGADCQFGKAGQKVTMAVTPAETGDQLKTISTYLGGYKNRSFVQDVISPPVLVDAEKGKRIDFAASNVFQAVDPTVGRTGAIKEISHVNTRTDYETTEWALGAFISFQANAEAVEQYNVRQVTAKMLLEKVKLWRELALVQELGTVGNWNANNATTLLNTYQWNGGTNADPLKDIQALISASAQMVDLLVMSPDAAFAFFSHAKVIAMMRQVKGDEAQPEDVARSIAIAQETMRIKVAGLPDILIAPAKVQDATTGKFQPIWGGNGLGGNVIGLTVASGMSEDESSTHMTFRTRGMSGSGIVTYEYVPLDRGLNKGVMLQCGFGEARFFPSNVSGGLIKNVLQ